MKKAFKSVYKPKKVQLSDVAAAKPSRAATRALNTAIKRAHRVQVSTLHRARALGSN